MSFSDLYQHVAALGHAPIRVTKDIVPKVIEITSQDRVYFTPVDLDREVSLGHIKQYRESQGVYGEPLWISDIRYAADLNICWKRFVCCKELMHVFDSKAEQSDTSDKFRKLLSELESPPLLEQASEMYFSENRTKWKALAVLCPLPVRDSILKRREAGALPADYDVALELRIPEVVVTTILGDDFVKVVEFLTK